MIVSLLFTDYMGQLFIILCEKSIGVGINLMGCHMPWYLLVVCDGTPQPRSYYFVALNKVYWLILSSLLLMCSCPVAIVLYYLNQYIFYRYPDATADDLQAVDVCIICRETMSAEGGCKKLPCSHIFHASCLRSWFQRQQTCPTCRMEVRIVLTILSMTLTHTWPATIISLEN